MVSPTGHPKDEYSHLSSQGAAGDTAQMLWANRTCGRVPVAYERDTRSTEEAMIEPRSVCGRARKRCCPPAWLPGSPGQGWAVGWGAERDEPAAVRTILEPHLWAAS